MNIARKAGLAASVLAVLALAAPAFAQSSLAVAEAAAFMGGWTLGLDTPQGSMAMTLELTDMAARSAAKLAAEAGPAPGTTPITDISKDADKLVLRYTLNFQGMAIPAEIALGAGGRQVEGRIQLRRRPVHRRRHGRQEVAIPNRARRASRRGARVPSARVPSSPHAAGGSAPRFGSPASTTSPSASTTTRVA